MLKRKRKRVSPAHLNLVDAGRIADSLLQHGFISSGSYSRRAQTAGAGRYESKLWHDKDYPKIQILTIEGLLNGTERVEAPTQINPFAKAQREGKPEKQTDLI